MQHITESLKVQALEGDLIWKDWYLQTCLCSLPQAFRLTCM